MKRRSPEELLFIITWNKRINGYGQLHLPLLAVSFFQRANRVHSAVLSALAIPAKIALHAAFGQNHHIGAGGADRRVAKLAMETFWVFL